MQTRETTGDSVRVAGTLLNKNNMENVEYVAKQLIYRYNIYQDGKCVESNIVGWKTALAHARRYTTTIFKKHVVEICNAWTAEIISIEEAEKRANEFKAANSRH